MRIILLLLVITNGEAQSGEFSAKFESFNHFGTKKDKVIGSQQKVRAGIGTEISDVELGSNIEIGHDYIKSNNRKDSFQVNELYLKYIPMEYLTLIAGRKYSMFGRTDEYNPTDFGTSQDYSYFYIHEKGKRIFAKDMVSVAFGGERSAFLIEWIVNPRSNLYSSGPWSPFIVRSIGENELLSLKKDSNLDGTELNFKYTLDGESWSADVVFFNGHERNPYYVSSFNGSGFDVTPKFERYTALGFSGVLAAGNMTFRAEASYRGSMYITRRGLTSPLRTDIVDTAIGFDCSGDFYLNMQYMSRIMMDAGGNGVVDDFTDYLLLKVEDTFLNDDLKISLRLGIELVSENGYLINPGLEYSFMDNAKLGAGIIIIGDGDGLFGQYAANDMIYTNLTLSI